MGLLYRLEKKLTERVENEVEKSEKDMEFAAEFMAENQEVQDMSNSVLNGSAAVSLLKLGLPVGSVYAAWTVLSFSQFAALMYLLVGLLTAKFTEYGFSDPEYVATVLFWLPAVLYGVLPDRVRLDK